MKETKRDAEDRKIAFYERRSEFDWHEEAVADKFKLALEIIEPTKKILEVGCGDGSFLKLVCTTLDPEIACGVDISGRSLKIAKDSGVEVIRCDLDEGLPFKNESFNLVLCFDVIEHLFDPDNLLTEAYRVLSQGGSIVITTPNLASWYNRIGLLLGWQPFWTEVSTKFVLGNPIRKKRVRKEQLMPSGHLRIFTTKALLELLNSYSYSVEIAKGYPYFSGKSLGTIDSILSNSHNLASFIMIKAKKITK